MKTIRIFTTLLVLGLTGAGCVNLNRAMLHPQILPQPALNALTNKSEWLSDVDAFPGLQGILGNRTDSTKTRIIATDHGNSSRVVTIKYEDIASNNVFDPGSAVRKALKLSFSLLSSDSGVSTRIYRHDLKGLVSLIEQLSSFQGTNFQMILHEHVKDLLAEQSAGYDINNSTSSQIDVSLDALLAAYLKAYLCGTFVDRWGTPISQPDISKLGNDTVVPLTRVVLEAAFDYSLMTPIIYDPNQSSTNKTPTFAVIFPQLYEDLSTNSDAPGVTAAELSLIKDFSKADGEVNNLFSSLLIKALGGASVGVKVSTGDNSTLSQILSTLCSELSSRATEEITYNYLEKFRYHFSVTNHISSATNDISYMSDYAANDTNHLGPHLVQDGVALMLQNQDDLNRLIQNGGKLSSGNLTNYVAPGQGLIAISAGGPPLQVDTNLFELAQNLSQNKGDLSPTQQQALIKALNQIVQTFETRSASPGTN